MLTKRKLKITSWRPVILSRHPSHNVLRGDLPLQPFRSLIRFGSTTTKEQWNRRRPKPLNSDQLNRVIEINSVEGVRNSASKLLMKIYFTNAGIKTAEWLQGRINTDNQILEWADRIGYPIVSKSYYGSRGEGNRKHDNRASLEAFCRNNQSANYIFEKFYNYNREYRLHVSKNGCFYTCRKLLKKGTPENQRWQRHDDNCVWYIESNPGFDKPVNWDTIVQDCVKALDALGLDIAGFDVKVQSRLDNRDRVRNDPEYIIIESNSACSFGEGTSKQYYTEINKLLKDKYGRNN
jgi:hypothetical protein